MRKNDKIFQYVVKNDNNFPIKCSKFSQINVAVHSKEKIEDKHRNTEKIFFYLDLMNLSFRTLY